MEGRISRESLNTETKRDTGSHYSSPVRYQRSSYRKRNYKQKREIIPEGGDLFVVQILTSGVFLLFIMFVTIVDTSQTLIIREKLGAALGKNTSFEEVSKGYSKVKGLAAELSSKELFGGEIEEDAAPAKAEEAAAGEAHNTETGIVIEEDVIVDSDTLKEIMGSSEEEGKN